MTSLLLVAVGCLTLGVLLGRWSVLRNEYVRHALMLLEVVRASPPVIFWAASATNDVLVSAGGGLRAMIAEGVPEHLQQGARDGYLTHLGPLQEWGEDAERDAAIVAARLNEGPVVWYSIGPSGNLWMSVACLVKDGVVAVVSLCLAGAEGRVRASVVESVSAEAIERLRAYAELQGVPDADRD